MKRTTLKQVWKRRDGGSRKEATRCKGIALVLQCRYLKFRVTYANCWHNLVGQWFQGGILFALSTASGNTSKLISSLLVIAKLFQHAGELSTVVKTIQQ